MKNGVKIMLFGVALILFGVGMGVSGAIWFGASAAAILSQVIQWEFPIVKDTTPQTHAYITSRTSNLGGTPHEKTDFL